jgi:hypothetical protein
MARREKAAFSLPHLASGLSLFQLPKGKSSQPSTGHENGFQFLFLKPNYFNK